MHTALNFISNIHKNGKLYKSDSLTEAYKYVNIYKEKYNIELNIDGVEKYFLKLVKTKNMKGGVLATVGRFFIIKSIYDNVDSFMKRNVSKKRQVLRESELFNIIDNINSIFNKYPSIKHIIS